MDEYYYNREAKNTRQLITQLLNKIDGIRGEIFLSEYEEDTGRRTVDSYDKLKFKFFELDRKIVDKSLSLNDVDEYNKTILKIFEELGLDLQIGALLNNISLSMIKLLKYKDMEEDDI